jgi:hypothetical protein
MKEIFKRGIFNLNFLGLTESNIENIALHYSWSAHDISKIEEIKSKWLDSGIALFVLLFFSEDLSGYLLAYWPMVSVTKKNIPKAENLDGAIGEKKITGVEPHIIVLKNLNDDLSDKDKEVIIRTMEKKYWHGHTAFRMFGQLPTPTKVEKADSTMQARYTKKQSLDWHSVDADKKLIKSTKPAAKPAGLAKKSAMKKPATKVDELVSTLQKLYSKRSTLDRQIADAEKRLIKSTTPAAKTAGVTKKVIAKAPAVKPAGVTKKATAKAPAAKAAGVAKKVTTKKATTILGHKEEKAAAIKRTDNSVIRKVRKNLYIK